MKTVHVTVTLHVVLKVDDDADCSGMLDESEFVVTPGDDAPGYVEDVSVEGYEFTDSH